MLVTIPSIPRLVVIPLFLLTCGIFFMPRSYHGSGALNMPLLTGKNLTAASSTFNTPVRDFWQELSTALLQSQPQCEPLRLQEDDAGPTIDFLPLQPNQKHPDRILNLSDKEETVLLRAHYAMRKSAQRLAPKIQFAKGTTGIVTTADAWYMPIFLVSLRMLRRTGCDLPIEVFIDDWTKYDPTVCDSVLPSLNARCVVMSNIYETAAHVKPPNHYQYKVFAILFSSFQHVLFLDSDAFPTEDPTKLFSTAPYTTHGLVTWPDFWAQTISAHFYHIAAIPEVPSQSRLSTESGQLLINKDMHRTSLLMMVYYNYYGPDYYYILLSQGSPGAGDKETFVQAALAVGLPYYQVRTPPGVLGNHMNGTFRGVAITQADPILDYEYLIPMRSHIHPDTLWQDTDLAYPDAKVDKGQNKKHKAPHKPQPIFIHQNNLKLDPAKVLEDERVYGPDNNARRMWSENKDMEEELGYDVERRLWDVITEEGCRLDKSSKTCRWLVKYIDEVFH
jgi:alpha 1,2-mannosyltransferase